MRTLAALLLAFVLTLTARAEEPWLKPNDLVALVGGEDMVALAEEGWLETFVTWDPGKRIRFRSLAWEGDTVFEQRRDLNYPTLETQLDKMGATAVICQFGKMESFAGKEGVAAFTEAYEKLIARLSGEKKRRIAFVLPARFSAPPKGSPASMPDLTPRNADFAAYIAAIKAIARKHSSPTLGDESWMDGVEAVSYKTRDGIHVATEDQLAHGANLLLGSDPVVDLGLVTASKPEMAFLNQLRAAIGAKNRLWFHYTRPQNWAFLAGNRTNQPSSRDHRDPTKRWFPEEMEQWLPLIEAKEQEIWKLAAAPR